MTTYVDHDTWTVLKRDDSVPLRTGDSVKINEDWHTVHDVLTDSSGRTVITCDPA